LHHREIKLWVAKAGPKMQANIFGPAIRVTNHKAAQRGFLRGTQAWRALKP